MPIKPPKLTQDAERGGSVGTSGGTVDLDNTTLPSPTNPPALIKFEGPDLWTPSPAGFRRTVGGFDLAVTDQRHRHAGWCWHVSLTEPHRSYEGGEVMGGAGQPDADTAKHTAQEFARRFCECVLSALSAAERA